MQLFSWQTDPITTQTFPSSPQMSACRWGWTRKTTKVDTVGPLGCSNVCAKYQCMQHLWRFFFSLDQIGWRCISLSCLTNVEGLKSTRCSLPLSVIRMETTLHLFNKTSLLVKDTVYELRSTGSRRKMPRDVINIQNIWLTEVNIKHLKWELGVCLLRWRLFFFFFNNNECW